MKFFLLLLAALCVFRCPAASDFDDGNMPKINTDLGPFRHIGADVVTAGTREISAAFSDAAAERSYSVVDFWGETVRRGTVPANAKSVSFAGLEPGSYTLRLSSGGETRFAVVGPIPPIPRKRSRFGMNTHFGQLVWPEELRQMVRAAGISELRESVAWSMCEREKKGVFDLRHPVPAVVKRLAGEFRVLDVAAYGSRLYDKFSSPHTPEGVAAWKRYLAWTIENYPEFTGIEIWNEFNAAFHLRGVVDPTPENYLALSKASFEAIKAKNPAVRVVGCSTSLLPWGWLETYFKLGGLDYLDIVSVHPYRWGEWATPPETLCADMVKLRKLIDRYAGTRKIPIWADEFGYPVGAAQGVSLEMQAAYIPRSFGNFTRSGVERAYWYTFVRVDVPHQSFPWQLGLLTKSKHFRPDPSYSAFAAMTRALDEADLVGEVSGIEPALGLKFRRDDRDIYQLWGTGKPVVLEAEATGPVEVVDLVGKKTVLTPVDGKIDFLLNTTTVYLSGPVRKIAKSGTVSLDEKNPAFLRVPMKLDFRAPSGFRLRLRGKEFDPGAVELPGSERVGGAAVRGELLNNGKLCGLLFFEYEVSPQLSIETMHMDSTGALVVRTANRFPSARKQRLLSARGSIDGKEFFRRLDTVLPEQDIAEVKIPLQEGAVEPFLLHKVELTLEFADHDPLRIKGKAGYNPCFYMADFKKDGELSEWRKLPAIDLEKHGIQARDLYGAHGFPNVTPLRGKIWTAWNEKFLFVAAEIEDDTHHQLFPLWMGDSIQFGTAPGKADPMTTVEFESAWRAEYDDSMVFAGKVPAGFDGGNIRRTTSCKFRRDGNRTIYEMAVPWSALYFVKPQAGGVFRFSAAVNDNNGGKNRFTALCWGDGIVCTKSSGLYPVMTFEKDAAK